MGIDIKSTNLQELLHKELTRKQFLQVLVMLIISVLGFNNVLSLITKMHGPARSQTTGVKSEHGFGSSRFGI